MSNKAEHNFDEIERAKEILNEEDLFYSESNIEHLRRGVEDLNAGKGVPHEIIEIDNY